jgi:hypothetical protein
MVFQFGGKPGFSDLHAGPVIPGPLDPGSASNECLEVAGVVYRAVVGHNGEDVTLFPGLGATDPDDRLGFHLGARQIGGKPQTFGNRR